ERKHATKTASKFNRSQLVELKIAGFPIERQWSVVWRRDRPLSAAGKRFVEYLQSA
ncbi:MAG: LysR substrate-binding domain-containing protein, partial [Casimicrobium sp.]